MPIQCVEAFVRRVGAGGIFYWVKFPDAQTQNEWYEIYNDVWELYCFKKDTPK